MTIQDLIKFINTFDNIEVFAEQNLLKLAKDGNRYILNYSEQMLGTPKGWISHFCRGLTLVWTPHNYKIAAKSFDRFYNLHENPEYLNREIDFNKPFDVYFKYDWSIILEYEDSEWYHVQTRWSFANGAVSTWYNNSYEDLFVESEKIYNKNLFPLDEGETAIWELCSPYNQVVEYYETPFSVLLGIVRNDGTEVKDSFSGASYKADNIDGVFTLLDTLKPTQEWFVIAQWNEDEQKYFRVKCKTKTWVELSHFSSWLESKDSLWNVVFSEEIGEVISVFPHLEDKLVELNDLYHKTMHDVENAYETVKHIQDQKEFAMAVKSMKFNDILFDLKKRDYAMDKYENTPELKEYYEIAEQISDKDARKAYIYSIPYGKEVSILIQDITIKKWVERYLVSL